MTRPAKFLYMRIFRITGSTLNGDLIAEKYKKENFLFFRLEIRFKKLPGQTLKNCVRGRDKHSIERALRKRNFRRSERESLICCAVFH